MPDQTDQAEYRIEVESDGTPDGTSVSIDGKKLALVKSLKVTISAANPYGELELVVASPILKIKNPDHPMHVDIQVDVPVPRIESVDELFDPKGR